MPGNQHDPGLTSRDAVRPAGERALGRVALLVAFAGLIYLAVTFAPQVVASVAGMSAVGSETLGVAAVAVVALYLVVKVVDLLLKLLLVLLVIGAIVYSMNANHARPHRARRQVPTMSV